MTRRILLLLCVLGLCVLVLDTRAEEKAPAKERLRPEGIDGTLVLCGGKVSDAARARFFDLAGKDKAKLVVVVIGDKAAHEVAEKLAAVWEERKPESLVVLTGGKADPKLIEVLPKATGVWFAGTDPKPLLERYRHETVHKELTALLKRGGVVGATDGSVLTPSGFGLLPGVLVEAKYRKEGEKSFLAALEKTPGVVGLGLGDEAAVFVRGRDLSLVGEGAVVCLAKSEAKKARTIELSARAPSDLTLWRRCAIARAETPFPPKLAPVPEVKKGSLVIVGGGGMPAPVTKKFIDLAGGPDALIIVLPTAQPDPLPPGAEGGFLSRAGAKHVVVLQGRSLEEVENPKNLELFKRAGGIWFGGGRQWRFIDAYEGTKAAAAFHDVLNRGGVIGGSSAGASIQGDYMCRGNPLGNLDIMCEGYERGLGFLPGTAIDQHFAQRKRFDDMTALVKTYPQLLGIGLDEATALIVKGHVGEVMGQGEAHFFDRKKGVEKDKPDHESIKAGGRYDLKERKGIAAEKK